MKTKAFTIAYKVLHNLDISLHIHIIPAIWFLFFCYSTRWSILTTSALVVPLYLHNSSGLLSPTAGLGSKATLSVRPSLTTILKMPVLPSPPTSTPYPLSLIFLQIIITPWHSVHLLIYCLFPHSNTSSERAEFYVLFTGYGCAACVLHKRSKHQCIDYTGA